MDSTWVGVPWVTGLGGGYKGLGKVMFIYVFKFLPEVGFCSSPHFLLHKTEGKPAPLLRRGD